MTTCGCNMQEDMGLLKCSSTGRLLDKEVNCDCHDQGQIIVKGICPRTKVEDLLTEKDKLWTQIFIPEVLCVPSQKPDIEQLLSVTAVPEIISQRVVKTPVLKLAGVDKPIENKEGIVTTGRKLVIEGILRQKVTYCSNTECQSVHGAHFDLPFSAFIILPADTKLTTRYEVSVCIEDIFICLVSNRNIFKNVTIFIKAQPLVCS